MRHIRERIYTCAGWLLIAAVFASPVLFLSGETNHVAATLGIVLAKLFASGVAAVALIVSVYSWFADDDYWDY